MDLTTTTETVNTEWLRIARPIILAMFAVEDAIHPVGTARLADPLGYVSYGRMSPASHAWEEAQIVTSKAFLALKDILEGVRENALCDAFVSTPDDATDTEADAIDDFNDDLRKSVVSVDGAVKMLGDEQ
jgi:voltage-gated potassium channel Kch